MELQRWFPFLKWYPRAFANISGDLIAGCSVGIMVIPQSLAYAQIAGLPHQYGLYSSYIGVFVYMLLGTSLVTSVGPTSIVSLVVASSGQQNALHQTPVANAILLAFLAGIMQAGMGILRLGFVVELVSFPCIAGFTSAAAIVIAAGQLKHLLAISKVRRAFDLIIADIINHIDETHKWDALLGCGCIVVLISLDQLKRRLPHTRWAWVLGTSRNAITAICATLLAYALRDNQPFEIIGDLPSGLPSPEWPVDIGGQFGSFWKGALTIALISYLENVAISKAFAREANYTPDMSQELVALGCCNTLTSFFQGYPVTGSFSRTTVTCKSGGRTPAAQLLTGGIVIAALVFMMPLFFYIPKSSLAAIVICAVLLMVDASLPMGFFRERDWQALVSWTLSFVGTLFLGIEVGVLVGTGWEIVCLLARQARPIVEQIGDDNGRISVRVQGPIHFVSADFVKQSILSLVPVRAFSSIPLSSVDANTALLPTIAETTSAVFVNCSDVSFFDSTGCHALESLRVELEAMGVALHVENVASPRAKQQLSNKIN